MLKLLAIFLVFAAPARAGFTCHKFAELPFPVQDCDDNEKVGHDALSCVRGYRDHVKEAQAQVLAKFQAQVAKLREQQSDSFDRTQAGYDDARKQLDGLIADGKTARAAVDDLFANLFFPEDYDEPEVTGMKTQSYLAKSKCYAVPYRVLQQSQLMIDKMMEDLEATESTVTAMLNTSGTRSEKVQKVSGARGVSSTKGQGSGKATSGESQNSESDITGTKPPGADKLPQ